MSDPDPCGPFDAFVRNLIRYKACRLLGLPAFHAEERDDLEQELTLELWRRRDQFNAQRGDWPAFARMVVDHTVANLLRHRAAQKRSSAPTASLHMPLAGDGELTELGAQLGSQQHDLRHGRRRLSDEELAALRRDLAAVLAALPEEQRRVAEALKQCRSKAEAARRLDLSPAQLYAQVRQLRLRFEQARLQDYL